jgi:hypothetical protein
MLEANLDTLLSCSNLKCCKLLQVSEHGPEVFGEGKVPFVILLMYMSQSYDFWIYNYNASVVLG